jgi:hypothetical protein
VGLLFGSGWVTQRIQRQRVLHSPTDFVVQMQAQSATAQRQQRQRSHSSQGPIFWPRPVGSQIAEVEQ